MYKMVSTGYPTKSILYTELVINFLYDSIFIFLVLFSLFQGDFDSFEVQYLDAQDRLIQNSTDTNSITIGDLRPFRNYTFTIITRSGTSATTPRRSRPISAVFQTKESVPGSLTYFEPEEIQPSRISFVWELNTLEANGVITDFMIQYGPTPIEGQEFIPTKSREFGAEERRGTIEGLIPGQRYTFQVQARTQVGAGEWVQWEQEMPIWAPPVPNKDVKPTDVSHNMNSITIRFRRNYFSDVNGKVIAYSVSNSSIGANKGRGNYIFEACC